MKKADSYETQVFHYVANVSFCCKWNDITFFLIDLIINLKYFCRA